MTKKCLHRYTMACLKLDLIRTVDRLGAAGAYQLLPGVSLVRAADVATGNRTSVAATGYNRNRQQDRGYSGVPQDVIRSLVRGGGNGSSELDGYLMGKMDEYLSSLSISVKLVDSAVVESVRKLSAQMLVNVLPTDMLETGNVTFWHITLYCE